MRSGFGAQGAFATRHVLTEKRGYWLVTRLQENDETWSADKWSRIIETAMLNEDWARLNGEAAADGRKSRI